MQVSTSDLVMESFTDEMKFESTKHQKNKIIKVAPLQVDGLSFENNMLSTSDHFKAGNSTNNIFIYFKEAVKGNPDEDPHIYPIPLYSTYTREKLLCTINLNTRLDKNDIIYSGTALIVPNN